MTNAIDLPSGAHSKAVMLDFSLVSASASPPSIESGKD